MRQRCMSAMIGIPLLILVLCFYKTIVFNLIVGCTAMIAVYEVLRALQCHKNYLLTSVGLLAALYFAFLSFSPVLENVPVFLAVYIFILFCILLSSHMTVHFQQITVVFTASILFPLGLCSLIYLRDLHGEFGLFYLILVFVLSWICDAGAYFVGRKFGKHKMAPQISPHKTIEGAIGGVVTNLVFTLIFGGIWELVYTRIGIPAEISYLNLTLVAVLGSLISMFGDLSASVIKRHCQIKDFGNLIPGHGGIMDRFDSVIFVAPFLYLISQVLPVIAA